MAKGNCRRAEILSHATTLAAEPDLARIFHESLEEGGFLLRRAHHPLTPVVCQRAGDSTG